MFLRARLSIVTMKLLVMKCLGNLGMDYDFTQVWLNADTVYIQPWRWNAISWICKVCHMMEL